MNHLERIVEKFVNAKAQSGSSKGRTEGPQGTASGTVACGIVGVGQRRGSQVSGNQGQIGGLTTAVSPGNKDAGRGVDGALGKTVAPAAHPVVAGIFVKDGSHDRGAQNIFAHAADGRCSQTLPERSFVGAIVGGAI